MWLASSTFLARPRTNSWTPEANCGQALPPRRQLLGHVPVADDGPGDQLREHGHVGAEAQQIPLGRHLAAVDVDGIAHGLEDIKGDADGQRDLRHRQPQSRGQQQIHRPHEEACVFEEGQQPQVQNQRQTRAGFRPRPAACSGDQQAAQVIEQDGKEHEEKVHRLSPAVKQQADREQQQISKAPRAEIVQQQRSRQEEKEKNIAGKPLETADLRRPSWRRGGARCHTLKLPRAGEVLQFGGLLLQPCGQGLPIRSAVARPLASISQ